MCYDFLALDSLVRGCQRYRKSKGSHSWALVSGSRHVVLTGRMPYYVLRTLDQSRPIFEYVANYCFFMGLQVFLPTARRAAAVSSPLSPK